MLFASVLKTVAAPELFAAFIAVVIVLLFLDLIVFHRKAHTVRLREALLLTAFWISLSLVFNFWVWRRFGNERGLEFFTGYLLEYSLSVDNLFVFILLFAHFAVPKESQHRVLFWGILGAIVTRGVFILGGTALVQQFHRVLYLFGGFLLFTGAKLLFAKNEEEEVKQSPIVRYLGRHLRITPGFHGASFLVRHEGRLHVTPLFLVLIAVESTDVLFATDSIPAIFGITTDPFIIFTSNICAILGLRSLYFVLSGFMTKFRYLNVGLGLVLAFIGLKMVALEAIDDIKGHEWFQAHVANKWTQSLVSLGMIVVLIGGSILASLRKGAKEEPAPAGDTGKSGV